MASKNPSRKSGWMRRQSSTGMTCWWRGLGGAAPVSGNNKKKNKKLYKRSARLVTNHLKVNSRRCETLPASLIKIKKRWRWGKCLEGKVTFFLKICSPLLQRVAEQTRKNQVQERDEIKSRLMVSCGQFHPSQRAIIVASSLVDKD